MEFTLDLLVEGAAVLRCMLEPSEHDLKGEFGKGSEKEDDSCGESLNLRKYLILNRMLVGIWSF